MLNITGGKFKGIRLSTPKGNDFRPTLGKTKEALFNVITSRYELTDYDCYDLFAGSGALGLEAISRGAKRTIFVENSKPHVEFIKQNIRKLSLEDRTIVYKDNAIHWLSRISWDYPLNLFLIDPPYQTDLAQEVLDELGKAAAFLQESLVVVESSKKKTLIAPECLALFQQKAYGSTKLEFFQILN